MSTKNYLYTVRTFQSVKNLEGEASCLKCQQVISSRRHPCIECQIEAFAIWQVVHKLGLDLDDVVYVRKEIIT